MDVGQNAAFDLAFSIPRVYAIVGSQTNNKCHINP